MDHHHVHHHHHFHAHSLDGALPWPSIADPLPRGIEQEFGRHQQKAEAEVEARLKLRRRETRRERASKADRNAGRRP